MKLVINDKIDKLKLSKSELARQLGLSYPTVLDMCNGVSCTIRLDTLEKLCSILRCTPNDILIFDHDTQSLASDVDIDINKTDKDITLHITQDVLKSLNKSKNLKLDVKTTQEGKKQAYLIFDLPGESNKKGTD